MASESENQERRFDYEPVLSDGDSNSREACSRQVFASVDVARRFVRQLERLGILSRVERCDVCGLVHVRERAH
jgi:hypothetical protein